MFTESKIRETIAESGKTKISDIMNYFKNRYFGRYNPKMVRKEAKEMLETAEKDQ